MKENIITVIIIEPGKPAYKQEIENTFESLKHIVDGWIEITYPLDDALIIGNEEAKLLGLKGNVKINNEIYCGNLIICNENNEGDCASLRPEQVEKYLKRFSKPQEISEEEISDNMNMNFYIW